MTWVSATPLIFLLHLFMNLLACVHMCVIMCIMSACIHVHARVYLSRGKRSALFTILPLLSTFFETGSLSHWPGVPQSRLG